MSWEGSTDTSQTLNLLTLCCKASMRPVAQVGSISGISFRNIRAVSENGIFIAGCSDSLIKNIHFQVRHVITRCLLNFLRACGSLLRPS